MRLSQLCVFRATDKKLAGNVMPGAARASSFPRWATTVAAFPLLALFAVAAGCQQSTTDRIVGTEFFADFEAQLNYHDLGINPAPRREMLGIAATAPSTQPAGLLAAYYRVKDQSVQPDPAVLKALRNQIVHGLMALDEQDFQGYTGDIGHVQRSSSVLSDVMVLALTASATVTGGAEAKSILAALAAVFTGGRIAVDKDIFFQNTFPALVLQMQTKREQQRAAIQQKLSTLEDADYPVSAAFIDVLVLYRYGTITGAIASISQPSSAVGNISEGQTKSVIQGPATQPAAAPTSTLLPGTGSGTEPAAPTPASPTDARRGSESRQS